MCLVFPNFGLTDPAQNTALSLSQSTVALVTLASSIDRVCIGRVLGDLAKDVGEEFWKVEQEIAAEQKQKAVVEKVNRGGD
jgi:hypothetical protein